MSAINQYFGQNAVSAVYQYLTPQKNTNYLNTNASLGYSSFGSSNQFKSSQLKSQLHTHITMGKDTPYSDVNSQRDYIMQNNSVVTLNPVESVEEIGKFLQLMKLIQYLSRQHHHQRSYLYTKQQTVSLLTEKVYNAEREIAKQKKKYETGKKELQARQDRINKRKRKRHSLIEQELQQMIYVLKVKHSLSKNKNKKRSPPHNKQHRPHTRRYSEYLPAHPNYSNTYPFQLGPNYLADDPSNRVVQTQRAPVTPLHLQGNNPHYSIYNPENKPQHNSVSMSSANIKQSASSKVSNPLDLLLQKLRTESQNPFRKSSKNEGSVIKTKNIIELQRQQPSILGRLSSHMQLQNMNRYGSLNIKINQVRSTPQPADSQPDLAYFQQQHNQASKIMNKSQKAQQEQKENSQHQDLTQMISIMSQSIRMESKLNAVEANSTQQNKKTNKSEMGFNLIESNLGDEFVFNLPQHSRQRSRINNNSKIDISIDSEQKRHSKSRNEQSIEFKSKKQFSKSDFQGQSNINIQIEESVSPQHSQGSSSSTFNLIRRIQSCSPQKILTNIEEVQVEQDMISRQNTPVDLTNHYEFKSVTDSNDRLRKSKEQEKYIKASGSHMSESHEQTAKTPPLSRPPSLIEEENGLQDSNNSSKGLSSIKLQTMSRRSRELDEQQTPAISKLNKTQSKKLQNKQQNQANSNIKQQNQANSNIKITESIMSNDTDEDDLFNIKLVTESRISRESRPKPENISQNQQGTTSLNYSQDFLPLYSKYAEEMSKSEPELLKMDRLSYEQKAEDPADCLNTLRKSTTSTIIKKGSAIQKVKDRQQVNNLKVSNYGKTSLKSSGFLSAPIVQDVEQDQQLQQPKRRNNISSLK